MHRLLLRSLPVAFVAALAGCASHVPPVAAAPVTPSPAVAPRPAPPAGFALSFATPVRDETGHYVTPSSGVDAGQAVWHVRAALNVAALACPQSDMAPAYNAMLARMEPAFAAADAATKSAYRARFGNAWQDAHDDAMTRVYNWFAQPHGAAGLCRAAAAALTEAQTIDPASASAFAIRQLEALEAPYLDGYRQWDAYLVADAGWRSRYEAPPAMLKLERTAAAR